MRNYFTFDGVDSRSFGVYISGQGTFKAPARSYDAIEIPGKNGALLGIDSRLGNVELTYPAFIYSNFAENIAAFRAFLLSHKGYFKLKDSYHPNEFRLAYYPGPFEPDVTSANNAGSFDITFICKPQRYLESGQEVVELSPSTAQVETYTGNIVEIEPGIGDRVTGLTVPFIPIQDLHGYSHPWPAGGGKNKADIYGVSAAGIISPSASRQTSNQYGTNINSVDYNGQIVVAQSSFDDSASPYNYRNGYFCIGIKGLIPEATYKFCADIAVSDNHFGVNRLDILANGLVAVNALIVGGKIVVEFVYRERDDRQYLEIRNSGMSFTLTNLMVIASTETDTSFAPYANICPISGRTGLSVFVGPTTAQADATTYAVDWTDEAGTVYGGTVDVVTGLLTIDRIGVDGGSVEWTKVTGNAYRNFSFTPSPLAKYIANRGTVISSQYKSEANNTAGASDDNYVWIRGSSTNNTVCVKDTSKASLSASDFKTAMSSVQFCYELATPITYQLSAQEITLIQNALNYIWSNAGPVTVEVTEGLRVTNPTLFDAMPFLRVYGTGILGIGSHTINITAADVYTDIDCEMMDCFKGSANKNQYVQFSGNDFPTLEPGVNGFSFSGITKVEVKPRWWSV